VRRALLAVVLLTLALRAAAGPSGDVDSHAAPATGFPGAFLETLSLSMADDPRYGSRLLDGLDLHLRSVSSMTAPRAVSDYLESTVMSAIGGGRQGADRLAAMLGQETMDPAKASALLIANALSRPDQFREVLEGLETLQPGLRKHAARLLREAKGTGDKKLLKVLRAAGVLEPRGEMPTYGSGGVLALVFDSSRRLSSVSARSSSHGPSDGVDLRTLSLRLD